ncbi:uncharacterized protein BXZ73DRAFT_78697 [Epithele typhae]|uniref:uncharacterized protein n=1 Tax=Epithele typhae TaxID=378194 RepID=UPI002008E26E|nr:uncharacterized protein BXZ73DRAFT_78697 [Epithele typhae]KAH9926601.1 hypothetical protein BXZ73DRAFT_78697 [Epithele typhae]
MSGRTHTDSDSVSTPYQTNALTIRILPTHFHPSQSPHQPDDVGHLVVAVYPRRNTQLQLGRPALPYAPHPVPIAKGPAGVPSAHSPTQLVAAPPPVAAPGEIGRHKCPHCNYTSNRKLDLRRHLETHAGGSTPPRWICSGVPLAGSTSRGCACICSMDRRGWEGV